MNPNDVVQDNGKILDSNDKELQPEKVDLDKGYLLPENIFIKHHDEIPGVPMEFHYAVKEFYFEDGTSLVVESQDDPHIKVIDDKQGVFDYVDQGEGKLLKGIDLCQVIDVERKDPIPGYDEYETIQRYVLFTPEELKANEKQKRQVEFIDTGADRLDDAEINIEDLTLLMAEMIGA